MSLQLAAQHLAAQGRGPDKQLVHMSPREVAGLQALAMAHGGSLSINPDTGLPEAGFLSDILPMVIGAGLTVATGGAFSPMMLGLGVGGVQALRTGDLGKGLMAGLGAYGGAGLAGGLMSAGAGTIDATQTALGAPNVATGSGSQAAMLAAQNEGFGQAGLQALGESAGYAKDAMPFVQTPMQSVTRGAQGLLEPAGREAFMKSVGGGTGLAKLGLAAAAPALMAQPKTETPKVDSEQMLFSYAPNRVADPRAGYPADYRGEYAYFRPQYTRLAEGGGIGSIAKSLSLGGGSLDDTSDYKYEYDPLTRSYKKIEPPKPEESGKEKTTFGDTRGGGDYSPGSVSSGRETDMSPFSAIAAGQALQSYGNMLGGFMPGGSIANAIGGGLIGYGQNAISQNQANVDAEMGAAMNAAQTAAQMESMANAQAADVAGAGAISNYGGTGAPSGDVSGGYGGVDSGGYSGDGSGGYYATGGITALARGGYSHLGDYSDGGRLLRGPGDGVSDSIPATIGNKRPARLADGEFVIPARIVSELGNGSTEAGARKLYAMMDRVQRARGKTTGKGKVAKNTRAEKYLPA